MDEADDIVTEIWERFGMESTSGTDKVRVELADAIRAAYERGKIQPPTQWPPHVRVCCECGAEIKNETYVVRQGRIFCDGCAATVED